MTPSGMNIDYKVSSFLHLHNNFIHNSLDSTCTCIYLIEGPIVFQSESSSMTIREREREIIVSCVIYYMHVYTKMYGAIRTDDKLWLCDAYTLDALALCSIVE